VVIDESLLPHLVDVEHPGSTTDRYDNPVDDWTPGNTSHADVAAWLQQNTSAEDTDQRSAQIGEWLMLCNPFDIDGNPLTVYGTARVHWQGLDLEVIGPPGPAYTPAEFHHYEIRLKAVEG
jgi:head-tail adaptor